MEVKTTFCSNEVFLCKNSQISCTAAASTYPAPAVAMSLKHLIGHLVPVKIIFQPYVILHPVSGICSSQDMNWSKCRNMTAAFELQIFAKPTGQTELASHTPPRPQPARGKSDRWKQPAESSSTETSDVVPEA